MGDGTAAGCATDGGAAAGSSALVTAAAMGDGGGSCVMPAVAADARHEQTAAGRHLAAVTAAISADRAAVAADAVADEAPSVRMLFQPQAQP